MAATMARLKAEATAANLAAPRVLLKAAWMAILREWAWALALVLARARAMERTAIEWGNSTEQLLEWARAQWWGVASAAHSVLAWGLWTEKPC